MPDKNNLIFPIPSLDKLSSKNPFYKEIINTHEEACRNKEDFYFDPETGYTVFTAYYHLKRGSCCGSGCRHCPFGG